MNCRTWMLSSWYVLANKRILTYMAVMISACVLFDSQLPVNGVPWPHLLHAAHPRTACCALNILLIKKLFDIYVLFFYDKQSSNIFSIKCEYFLQTVLSVIESEIGWKVWQSGIDVRDGLHWTHFSNSFLIFSSCFGILYFVCLRNCL